MPSLRIVTWNSTGEGAPREAELSAEVNLLNGAYPGNPVRIILNQEAQQAAGAGIYNMLNDATTTGLGGAYGRPPTHLQEHLNGTGDGYNVLSAGLTFTAAPQLHDYANDIAFNQWVNRLSPNERTTVWNTVANYRPPVWMRFTYGGSSIRLITWHAPLGRSTLLSGCTTSGGGLLDAFLLLEQSGLIRNVSGVDLIIIAGDLNMTSGDLRNRCQGYEPLSSFGGVSAHLDHVLAWRPNGGGVITFHEPRRVASPHSVHDIYSCRVAW